MSSLKNENLSTKSDVAKQEEAVLKFWQENGIFEKSVTKDAPNGEFVFYDGPPFATGLPHYGSLLSSIVKDVIPRYKTMQGFSVRRRWGWDCHGLPIENMVEKELGLKDKTEIIKEVGIKKFNQTCRDSVLRYADEWKKYVDRVGRWVEYDNAYMTMDNTFIESVWWAIAELYKKDLVYEGRKVLLYCPHCQTPIAKAEVAMDNSYKDITEEAVTVKFKVRNPEKLPLTLGDNSNVYILAWTTTPWTLPGNVALAVGENIEYICLRSDEDIYIVSKQVFLKENFKTLIQSTQEFELTVSGKNLVGLEYEPLYDIPAVGDTGKRAYYVASADFVTTDEGTGIVHTAVMYGEDDYELGLRLDLPLVPLLDEKGHFNESAPQFIRTKYFKQAEKDIKADLGNRGLLLAVKNNTHSYPHCHRCGTTLIYNALTSWFFNIQKVKERMIELNKDVSWVPGHLKEGRFLNIVENAPDWTISRNRFWASPLPIWKCLSCQAVKVVGSVEELRQSEKKSGNAYFLMRHAEAEHNKNGIIDASNQKGWALTSEGEKQAKEAGAGLKDKKISRIYTSPFARTKTTAKIVAVELGLVDEDIIVDERLRELDFGDLDGRPFGEFLEYEKKHLKNYADKLPGGESFLEAKRRFGEFIYELEATLENENILIVTHGIGVESLEAVVQGVGSDETKRIKGETEAPLGKVSALLFEPLPHNDDYELDFHRPYIDEVKMVCDCKGEMERIPEVLDGWVESASMPFAEYHYPFENKKVFEKRSPGDFVSEYIAQTRTWFYYMHAMSTMLFDERAFNNVLSTGTILAEDGSKMSKSKGNYTDPFSNFDRFGADALRYYLLTSVVMQSEDLRFSDREVGEAYNRVINILRNTLNFYKMYGEDNPELDTANSTNILDRWILSRLSELREVVTMNLDQFDTVRAGRPIKDFVNDFSTWYVRRSRDRFKDSNLEDGRLAIATTRHVLKETAKLIAPFMPFLAESIYQEVRVESDEKSVHLAKWPVAKERDDEIVKKMSGVRDVVSKALELRARFGIKVRQPLRLLQVKIAAPEDFLADEIIKDEINVKRIEWKSDIEEDVQLDIEITPELREEGEAREFIRSIQGLRKKMGLTLEDRITLSVKTNTEGRKRIETFALDIKQTVGATLIKYDDSVLGEEVLVDDLVFVVDIEVS
ncbi:MAG: hypothetical protein A2589_03740 [Candidatus Vogelbacteria bacterium RIFOXYD1_FULL_46_19]|uniref:isoleucine--tRNA ligase n=1 Tax=Candidatus Vogelbacteria bacterium RIFOXYD1_FULL_46_19 TaxID=1802439 RepID=A0A1G2QIK4_9BACT|nr:MAG: hypothetical protein A2589_03740 [Candidatus Vogelbacteria bacterium RIFOXYD1_FULL_46_19]